MKKIPKEERKWYVLYSRPNAEKKLAERLSEQGIEAYCPTRTEVRKWSDRKKKVQVPVLPSMVLVNIKFSQKNHVFDNPSAVRFLYWSKEPAVVTEEEVQALKESLSSSKTLKAETEKIIPGQKIDLSELGFEGQKGKVKYISGNQCWVILESIGYVVKVTLGD
ncbi:MAG: UpxY family transcription antiterminator [Flavobacteriaceae bacterium]|nr:UpxY family transcription antiterminator [Flavobacteriaceae bacterium]